MACFKDWLVIRGKTIEEVYSSPSIVSRLSNEDVLKFLTEYGELNEDSRQDFGLPRVIASPIDSLAKGKEFKRLYTGDIKYLGTSDISKTDFGIFSKDEQYKIDFYLSHGARLENRHVEIDTYFNKVLGEAVNRQLLNPINDENTYFLGDLSSLRFSRSVSRDNLQNRESMRTIQELSDFFRQSERTNIVVK